MKTSQILATALVASALTLGVPISTVYAVEGLAETPVQTTVATRADPITWGLGATLLAGIGLLVLTARRALTK